MERSGGTHFLFEYAADAGDEPECDHGVIISCSPVEPALLVTERSVIGLCKWTPALSLHMSGSEHVFIPVTSLKSGIYYLFVMIY